jgi:hypothetical protein
MSIPPFDYGSDSIRKLRMPEIEGAAGEWTSTWQLRLLSRASPSRLQEVVAHVAQLCGGDVDLVPLQDRELRLVVRSTVHPLDVEAYPLIDCILAALNEKLKGLEEINGSPRDWWRTFRNLREAGREGGT